MHATGVVHRDIKPANLMLVDDAGEVDVIKVCDFGLAKPMRLDDPGPSAGDSLLAVTTDQGDVCGTPGYMAPEQACGEEVDARADLYAVAAVLFHCLVGRPPFPGRSSFAVVSQQLTNPAPRPSSVRPDLRVFPALDALVVRGLARDRTERPSTAQVFRADLQQIARDVACSDGVTSDADLPVTLRSAPPGLAALVAKLVASRPFSSSVPVLAIASVFLSTSFFQAPRSPATATPSLAPTPRASAGEVPDSTPAPAHAFTAASPSPAAVASSAREEVRSRPVATRNAARSAPTLQQAEELLDAGRTADACRAGERAASTRPSAKIWDFLGRCYMRLGEPERARSYYRRYLTLAPLGSHAVFVRAMLGEPGP
jgi:serine/threonine-protein kinase